jgi:transposase-like protein
VYRTGYARFVSGVSHKATYSEEDLRRAIAEVLRTDLRYGTVSSTAAKYGVPRQTLADHVRRSAKSNRISTPRASHILLPAEGAHLTLRTSQEHKLALFLRAANLAGRGIFLHEIRGVVIKWLEKNMAAAKFRRLANHNGTKFVVSANWVRAFLKRNDLGLYLVRKVSDRVKLTLGEKLSAVQECWSKFDELCDTFRVKNDALFNFDETRTEGDKSSGRCRRVVGHKDDQKWRTVHEIEERPSFVACVRACGGFRAACVVHPLEKDSSPEKQAAFNQAAGTDALHLSGGRSGSMNRDIFHRMVKFFVGHIRAVLNNPFKWAILLMDGVDTHWVLKSHHYCY